jgi:hypothetical protein
VVVVDADSRDGLRWATAHLPYTPWQTKTSRGFHLFYRWPGQPVRNQARLQTADGQLAIDVRGDGGYVVGPGSLHASGARYEYAGDWTRSNVPRFWPGWLAREERRPATTRSTPIQPARPAGDVIDRARHYLGSIPRPEIGKGSDQAVLYAACKLVRGFALSDSDAVALLWEWAGGRPGWTHEWVARKVANAQQYGTEPVGALR